MARAVEVLRESGLERERLERTAQVELDREAQRQANVEVLIDRFRNIMAKVMQTLPHQTGEMKGTADTLARSATSAT